MWSAVLPKSLVREEGPPPPPPSDFGDGYVLPAHSEKPLGRLHSHPLDARLRFYEAPHVYTFDGVPTSTSVTALAHGYEKPFVAKDAIATMKSSRSQAWPRLEYVTDAAPLAERGWTSARGALLVSEGKTVAAVQPHSLAEGADVHAALRAVALKGWTGGGDDEDAEVHTFARCMSDEEIADGWSRKGRLASHKGTEAHYLAECFFNGVPVRWWEAEMEVVLDFARDHMVPRGIVAHLTEKEVVCADADLAGSIDLIVWDPENEVYHIVDFKRSDKLRRDLRGYGKMRAPFTHLDDCKGAAYALQTSIYQYVLERDYGMPIGSRVLLSIHPDNPFCTSVPYLRAEVEYIMENRIAQVAARRALAATDPTVRCALSGAPATDAVRLADGRIAMEKAAQVEDLVAGCRPDADVRARLAAHVATVPEVPLRRADCLPWRKRMPEDGLAPWE